MTVTPKIVVVGPGIVGMPMAALLADATRRLDAPTGEVVVIQRNSPTSGWKVDAINRGESPIGGVEPDLDRLVQVNATAGTLRASHSYDEVRNADVILVCVQTDKNGIGPDYVPLFEALHGIARVLAAAPAHRQPLVIIESTLAPSSMHSIVAPLFASYGLEDGRDIALGNSPNRVMPGRLVERVASADKIVGALRPETAARIVALYSRIVTAGRLLSTSSLTAEVVKTLENAYRDVRIAFAAELVRWCDDRDVDFFALRDRVNERLDRRDDASQDGTAVPSGALLVPTVGVGGHCLPKDGILLWWRAVEGGVPTGNALILAAREINDASPAATLAIARTLGAPINGQRVTVLGAAYRPDSEDTRNAASLQLALQLRAAGADVVIHDPYVRPHDANLEKLGLAAYFTNRLEEALGAADVVFVAVGHSVYRSLPARLAELAPRATVLVDAANLFQRTSFDGVVVYGGIGRGRRAPTTGLIESVVEQFRAMERGVANEVAEVGEFLNAHYADGEHNHVMFEDVRALARTCATGCDIVDRGHVALSDPDAGFSSTLARLAAARWGKRPSSGAHLTMRWRTPLVQKATGS
jgi:UDP-N-acetyl-D-mannosaminuronic acid dehydrogenase